MILQDLELYDPLAATTIHGDLEISEGRILRLGQNLGSSSGRDDRFRNRFLMPAFFDAHTHFMMGGQMLEQLDCGSIRSGQELLSALKQRCDAIPSGSWLEGFGLDLDRLELDLEAINRITARHYLFIQTHDLHSALANRPALEKAGINASTPDPANGRARRDPRGNPTGIVSEGLVWKMRQQVPAPTTAKRRKAIASATNLAHSLGITAVSENASPVDAQLYRDLDQVGELQMQVDLWYRNGNFETSLLGSPIVDTPNTSAHAIKCFIDGAFGSRSAAMYDRYRDREDRGVLMQEEDCITDFAQQAVGAGWQLVMHAIGDRAVNVGLNAITSAIERHGQGRGRHRLEHVQVIRPNDYHRMQKLQVVPSLQPVHLRHDQQWFGTFLTDQQLSDTYRWLPFVEMDMATPFGTDWPVEPLDPLLNLRTAVTRKSAAGESAFSPEQSFTLARALRGLTWDAAYGAFQEDRRGSLRAGMQADLVVLSENPFLLPVDELDRLEVLATWRRGETVYCKSGRELSHG